VTPPPEAAPWGEFAPEAFPFTIEAVVDVDTPTETVVWSAEVTDAGVLMVPEVRPGYSVAVRFRLATGEIRTYASGVR
jgi:hypothetical protein